MNKLLLIQGDLAAGKSTFAGILAKRYGTSAFCKDTIKEVLGNTIGFSNREENKRLSAAAVELMAFMLSEFGKLGKDLILEANFHTDELDALHRIAEKYRYEVLTIVLRADVRILHERYLHRMHHESRHPVHLSIALDAPENFERCIEFLRSESVPGKTIVINADDFSYQTDTEILCRIDHFMNA